MFKIVQYNLKTNVNKICYLQGHLHACTLQKKKTKINNHYLQSKLDIKPQGL